MASAPTPTKLLQLAGEYLSKKDREDIEQAYRYAAEAHAGQTRLTGEAFIVHSLAAAEKLAFYQLDATTLIGALLHDVAEDTKISNAELKRQFGPEIAGLVDGVTKLSKVQLKADWQATFREPHTDHSGENFEAFDRHVKTLRKMFLAMSRDIRVVLIKLADRWHNMSTLTGLPADKRARIAQETLEVYAPLANRLGIGQLKGELEDLAFPYAFPEEYKKLRQLVGGAIEQRQKYVERVRRVLLKRLAAIGIRAEAHGRVKHLYSLWRKLVRHDRDLTKIHDLVATRVIVPTVEDCYRALGLIHEMWRPLPGRIKDYIALPKPNGYQSLHTTVFALAGVLIEIQIRTPAMHRWAEYGIAAHWAYKDDAVSDAHRAANKSFARPPKQVPWVKELAKFNRAIDDPREWRRRMSVDFFEDRIFVFTPVGDVLDLPVEATPIDFAFAVHSDLGKHCVGAKVNGKLVSISHALENGDIVEIVVNNKKKPRQDWLKFAKTNRARTLIKRALQTQ